MVSRLPSSVAAHSGFSLLPVVVLHRPFAGDLTVSPAPYREAALAQYWTGSAPDGVAQ
ncbi:hypothetical protein [Streptomyces sp. NPDC026092]|uniref:hypothetical protein n=1 Tax=Streptomyces sp. NPDC026092 TaxID=3154797 RepID=UPI00340EEC60